LVTLYIGGENTPEIRKVKDKPLLRIGASRSNDLVLDDRSVSRTHAEIRRTKGGCFVADLRSTNGTLLNNRRIPVMKKMPFTPEDTITIGVYRLRVGGQPTADMPLESSSLDTKKREHQMRITEAKRGAEEDRLDLHRDPKIIQLKFTVHQELLDRIDLRRLDLRKIDDEQLRHQCNEIVSCWPTARTNSSAACGVPSNAPDSRQSKTAIGTLLTLHWCLLTSRTSFLFGMKTMPRPTWPPFPSLSPRCGPVSSVWFCGSLFS